MSEFNYSEALEAYNVATQPFLTLLIGIPRIFAASVFIPFLNQQALGSLLVRLAVFAAIMIGILPWLEANTPPPKSLTPVTFIGLMAKEALIGVVMGFILAIPFWALEGVGFFIDNQRGSTLASSINPLTSSQTSILGILFGQLAVVGFLTVGGFIILVDLFYYSYFVWPIDQFFPTFSLVESVFFIEEMDRLMAMVVILASPVIISMFLAEFCFALVNRSAQQLNVFVLSMPVKTAVAFIILLIYAGPMFQYMSEQEHNIGSMKAYVEQLLGVIK